MTIDTLAVVFGVFSAVANIVIAVIAARGRWWEKADKMEQFMSDMKNETSQLLREVSHITSNIADMKAEYKEFTKVYSVEMRDMNNQVLSHHHRLADIERRLDTYVGQPLPLVIQGQSGRAIKVPAAEGMKPLRKDDA